MQINNNPQVPSQTVAPNFKAIKSVKCKGLYKRHPELSKELVEAFRTNPKAMEFCKKYDVNIVFYACKEVMDSVVSSIHLFFENPTKTKFLGIFGSKQDKIEISGYGNSYNLAEALTESTADLKKHIADVIIGENTGILNGLIQYKEEEIQKILNEKTLNAKKHYENNNETIKKQVQKHEKAVLDSSIEDLINSSK